MVDLLQDAGAAAFLLLGVATAVRWVRRKDPSMGYLVLAIVLLSYVFLVGRVVALVPQSMVAVADVNLVAFVGSGYALLRFRGSLIPLPERWHIAAAAAILV
ncbi:MAG TPA: hypothetical protein VET26_04610, partial [Candidatus Sulfotelmatobacter sp.]|nr:hypothetical protein [Candidatus Sulfotelmatobacter sp.]